MAVHGLFDDVVLASSVEAEPLPMLWRERIPAASLSVIAGQPGAGKSTLECLIAEDEDRRALGCHKINGVDFPPGLVLEQSTVELPSEKGMVETGVLKIVGEVNADGEAVKRKGRRNTGRDDACAKWLSLFLAAGVDCSRMTREVRTEGTAAGFGWATLQRVGVTMRVEKVRIGFGGDGFWSWRLPDDHPLREQHAEETPVG